MSPLCEEPGCGMKKKALRLFGIPVYWACDRDADAHALCAKLAESEAKVKELDGALCSAFPANFLAVFLEDPEADENTKAVYRASLAREEARKKGAEHGE